MASEPDNGAAINGGMWIMTILPLLAISLRLYCKSKLGRVFGWDEYVLITSWVLLLVYTSCISGSVSLGVGKHLKDIAPENIAPALELVYIGEFIAIVACALAKTSFAITLLRTVTSQILKALLWFIIITMNFIMWMCAIIYLAQCKPTARLWDFTITEGYCWDPKYAADLAIAAGSYSGAMDFVLAILSWYIVWNLKITRKEKIGVGLAMSLGFFAGAVAIIKTTYLTNLVLVEDFTFYCSNVLIWACTETGVTQIAVCIPFFRTLLRSYSQPDSPQSPDNSGSEGRVYQLRNMLAKPAGESRSSYWQMGNKKDTNVSITEYASNNSITAGTHTRKASRQLSQNAVTVTNEITVTYQDAVDLKEKQSRTPTSWRERDGTDFV